MSHAIIDNAFPFDPARQRPWRRLGTAVNGCRDAHEALHAAGLAGWDIRKLAMSATELTEAGVNRLENPESVMLVRTDPHTGRTRYLSTVGCNYGIYQNEDGARVLDALVAEAGCRGFSDAGAINDGRVTFVSMQLPRTMYIAGVDRVDLYLVVFNSHDGSGKFRVMAVPFRPLCANQLPIAATSAVASVSLRHTSRSQINVAQIRSKLGVLYRQADDFEQRARRLLDEPMTVKEFTDLTSDLWPVSSNAPDRTRANAERRSSQLTRLWTSAETQRPIHGTRWAGLMAITEYLDHYQPAKDQEVRARRVVASAAVRDLKHRAFALLAG
jgi:phage/plasmid-like protein (TIGR03299 family)